MVLTLKLPKSRELTGSFTPSIFANSLRTYSCRQCRPWTLNLENWRFSGCRPAVNQTHQLPNSEPEETHMKRAYWVGFVATGLITISALSGCSGDADHGNPSATAGTGAGTTGGTGGSTGTGAKPGTMLTPANSYTVLSDADAPAATTAAPAKWGTYCGLCHGPNAQGISGLGTELRHVDATMATWVVRNGRNAMSKYSTTDVSDAELTEILTWLNALPKPTTPTGLYRDFCGTCHGPTTPSGGAVAI